MLLENAIRNAAITAVVLTVFAGMLTQAVAADATDITSALQGAPISTDLPTGEQGSGAAMTAKLRPELSYPTLRLDEREARTPQAVPQPTPAARAPKAPLQTDFQVLISQTLGTELPIFGSELFEQNGQTFESIESGTVPPDFVLGPGDEVYIRAWGSVDIDYRATIDRQGSITLPKVGNIPLAGVRFAELREHLTAAISRSFHGFELSVSLGQLRSIRIYVTGFARSPGTYTVSSLTTLINALFYAGGPDVAGDLRRIELRRSGALVAKVDFYDFLLSGAHDNDLRLLPEDVIHIPSTFGEVAIAGAVNRPGIYQLAGTETLDDLIGWGGGLGVTASSHRIVLERINANNQRTVAEFSYEDVKSELRLFPGDLVLVQPVSPQFNNAVTLRGHVAQPFRHEWESGMRVSDLLPSSAALISPGYWITRNESSQLVELLQRDVPTAVNANFPDINWNYALLERIDRKTLRSVYIPIDLGKAINERDPDHDLTLQPADKITVFALDDFRTPIAQRRRLIRVEGEVNRAGIYPVAPDATVADVIALAGGVTSDAYLFGTELLRESVRKQQQLRIQESIDQLEQDYNRHLIDRSRNVLSGDMSLAIAPETNAIRGLISRLREAKPSGRIVLELDGSISSTLDLPALPLDDGDTIYVPPKPATVEVVGAVFRQGSFLHAGNARISDYIGNAGLLETADSNEIYLVRPDGSFKEVGRRTALHPGDTIVVPEKTNRERPVRFFKDWTQVVYQLGLGAAGLSLLGVL